MTDKNWAQNCLRHNRNTALLSLAAMGILNSDTVESLNGRRVLIRGDYVVFNPEPSECVGKRYEFDLTQLVEKYRNYHDRYMETLFEFFKAARRMLVKESFEVVKAYAKAQGVGQVLKSSSWYEFARIVRNAISHDFHFQFKTHDQTLLPVRYGGVTIDSSLDGKDMPGSILPPGLAFDLYQEFVRFVETT
jgi:hypothetical protein